MICSVDSDVKSAAVPAKSVGVLGKDEKRIEDLKRLEASFDAAKQEERTGTRVTARQSENLVWRTEGEVASSFVVVVAAAVVACSWRMEAGRPADVLGLQLMSVCPSHKERMNRASGNGALHMIEHISHCYKSE